jgi:hypothetical protein
VPQRSTEEKRRLVALLKMAVKYLFIIWYVLWKCPNACIVIGLWGFGCSLVWAPKHDCTYLTPYPTRCQIARIRRPCFAATTEGRGLVGRISVRIREVSGSNLGTNTDYSDHVFHGGPPFPLFFHTCRNATVNETTAGSSHILASLCYLLIVRDFHCMALRKPSIYSMYTGIVQSYTLFWACRSAIIWTLLMFLFFLIRAFDSVVQRTKINTQQVGAAATRDAMRGSVWTDLNDVDLMFVIPCIIVQII